MGARIEDLQRTLEPVIAALGYELWGIDLNASSRHAVLRIYIDSVNGITVDDCATVSRHAGSALDVADPIPGAYTLEVSSPGWDRPLFTPAQYRRFLGERVKIRLALPLDGQRNLTGTLHAADAEKVEIDLVGAARVSVPFGAIRRANLIVESAPIGNGVASVSGEER